MTEEKNLGASKQPQDKADERLSADELDKVAGGLGETFNSEDGEDIFNGRTMGK